jgi:hypothetical protein
MSRESNRARRRRSKELKEQLFPISLFGECVVLASRGIKPAQWLADKAACTERHANLVIRGERKPSARAVHALNSAFFE